METGTYFCFMKKRLRGLSKKLIVILSVFLLIAISAYIYVRYHYLKVKTFKPDNTKAKNITDLTPAIIAKLQQVVKDGSDGLYVLSIEKLNIDVLASKFDAVNVTIAVDTTAMLRLDQLKNFLMIFSK